MASERIGLEAALEMDNWSKGVKQYKSDAQAMEKSTFSLARAMEHGLGEVIGRVIPKVMSSIRNYMGSFTRLAATEEVGIARLSAAVEASGAAWAEASPEIEAYLAAEAKRTALDDGEGRESVSRLTAITQDYRKALALLPVVQDLAAAKGMGLASAAQIVGRVVEGNTGILRRYGIVLEKGATATEALEALQQRFAGTAEAMANTYEGSTRRLDVATGNLKETIGGALLPILTEMKLRFADLAERLLPIVQAALTAIGPAIQQAAGMIWDALGTIVHVIAEVMGTTEAQGAQGGRAFGVAFAKGIEAVLPYIIGVIKGIAKVIQYWFKPHSPPKIAKDIDKWGEALVQLYFKSFKDADFGPVESFSSQLQGLLESAISANLLKPKDLTSFMVRTSGAFAQLFREVKQFGVASAASLQALRSQAGPVGAQVEKLARAFLMPDLTKQMQDWSSALSRSYLSIFTDADFGPVQGFSSQLQGMLQDALDMGLLDEQGVQALLRPTTGVFEQLFREFKEFGEVSDESFRSLRQQLGPLGSQVEKLARSFLMRDVTEEVQKWGEDLVKAYMGVFTGADFGPVENFSSQLNSLLSSGVKYGLINEKEADKLRETLGPAFNALFLELKQFGKVSEGSFANLRKQAGPLGVQVEKLARSFLGGAEEAGGVAPALDEAEKAAKGAGSAVADLEELLADLPSFMPDSLDFPEFELDTEKITAKANTIAEDILAALTPGFDTAGLSLAEVLGRAFRGAIATALLGPDEKVVPTSINPLGAITGGKGGGGIALSVVQEVKTQNDATWDEIGKELERRLHDAIVTAMTKLTGSSDLANFVGDHWKTILTVGLALKLLPIANAIFSLVKTAITIALERQAMEQAIKPLLPKPTVTPDPIPTAAGGGGALAYFGALAASIASVTAGLALFWVGAKKLHEWKPDVYGEIDTSGFEVAAETVENAWTHSRDWVKGAIKDIGDAISSFSLPGFLSGKDPIRIGESGETRKVKWSDILDTSGLTTAAATVEGTWKNIKAAIAKVDFDTSGLSTAAETVKGVWTRSVESIKEQLSKVKLPALDTSGLTTAAATITGTWANLKKGFDDNFVTPIGDFFAGDWVTWWTTTVPNAVTNAEAAVGGAFGSVWTWLDTKLIQPVSGFVSGSWTTWWTITLPGAITGAQATLEGAFGSVYQWITDKIITPIRSFISGEWTTWWTSTVPGAITGAQATISGAFAGVWTWMVDNLVTPVDTFFTVDWLNWWTVTLPTTITDAQDVVTKAVAAAWTWISDSLITPLTDFFTVTWPDWWTNVIPNTISGAVNAIRTAAGLAADALIEPFRGAYDTIIEWLNKIGLLNVPTTPPPPPASGNGSGGGSSNRYAQGTGLAPGGWATVGESGPELVWLPPTSKVIPLRSRIFYPQTPSAAALAGLGAGQTVNVTFGAVTISNGMDLAAFDAHVRRLVRQEVR